MICLQSVLANDGKSFYIKGQIFKTSDLTLIKRMQLLCNVYHVKLSSIADELNMCPQQLSYKIRHSLNTSDIFKISKFLGLNEKQIVHIFINT